MQDICIIGRIVCIGTIAFFAQGNKNIKKYIRKFSIVRYKRKKKVREKRDLQTRKRRAQVFAKLWELFFWGFLTSCQNK